MSRSGFRVVFCFAVLACEEPKRPPRIDSVSPARVDWQGGEALTVTGKNFEGDFASVSLGGHPCGEVQVRDATSITCVTPAVAEEKEVQVTVTNGGKTAGLASAPWCCLRFEDVRGPRVAEGAPLQDAQVSVLARCKVRFSEPVDASTLAGAFFISGGAGVTGALFCNWDCSASCAGLASTNAACFKPAQPLAYGTSYQCVVTDAVKDLRGHRLENAVDGQVRWSFTTRCQGCGNPWLGDIAAASGFTSSAKYKLYSVTGQPTPVGTASSASYKLQSGFIYSSQE